MELDKNLTLQTLVTAPDGTGGTSSTWSTVKDFFANVTVMGGKRVFINNQEYSTNIYYVTARSETLKFTQTIENYRFILNAYKQTITLKLINSSQNDTKQIYTTLTCIADDGQ